MRILILIATCLVGCGSSKKSDEAASAPAPEVTRLNIQQNCYSSIGDTAGTCTLTITGTYSTGTTISSPYSLVIAKAEGASPAACDGSSAGDTGNVIQFQSLKAETAYGLRACVFDGSKYSPGYAQNFTTGTP